VRAFEYHHVVCFEETNLVGNVYYVSHLRWMGRCREMFLRERAPGLADALRDGLVLATVRVSCDYRAEARVFDEIVVRMYLDSLVQNRVAMRFECWRGAAGAEELVAVGMQEIASMERDGERLAPRPLPAELVEALRPFQARGAAAPAAAAHREIAPR
jgi:enediyne biosynthesis thioesterase